MKTLKKIAVGLLGLSLFLISFNTALAAKSDYYINSSGQKVHLPMVAKLAPKGASAQCRDKTYSMSKHWKGTCSRHGGVAKWLKSL